MHRGNVAAHHRFAFGTRRTFVKSRQAEHVPPSLVLVLSHDLLEPGNFKIIYINHFHPSGDFSEQKNQLCDDVLPVALHRRPELRDCFVLASKLVWVVLVVVATSNCDWHRRNAISCVYCELLRMSVCKWERPSA